MCGLTLPVAGSVGGDVRVGVLRAIARCAASGNSRHGSNTRHKPRRYWKTPAEKEGVKGIVKVGPAGLPVCCAPPPCSSHMTDEGQMCLLPH